MQDTLNSHSWVSWFLNCTEEGKYFVEVDSEYIHDQFNLFGCQKKIHQFKAVLDHIKGDYQRSSDPNIDDWGIRLYGLIHARFLMTKQGLEEIHKKYINNEYDKCPNVHCREKCLPIGLSEQIGESCLYMYCPNCGDLYHSENPICTKIDGSAFGSSYIIQFFHQYPDVQPKNYPPSPNLRLFGFKIEVPPMDSDDQEEEESDDE